MVQRLLDRDGCELRTGFVEKWSARRSEPYTVDFFHASAAHALVDGIVFAVDGQQRLALLAGLGGDQLAGANQTFFIGQTENLSRADRFLGGFPPTHPA